MTSQHKDGGARLGQEQSEWDNTSIITNLTFHLTHALLEATSVVQFSDLTKYAQPVVIHENRFALHKS